MLHISLPIIIFIEKSTKSFLQDILSINLPLFLLITYLKSIIINSLVTFISDNKQYSLHISLQSIVLITFLFSKSNIFIILSEK